MSGFMRDFEAKLRTVIEHGEPTENIVAWVKKVVFESYKNGQKLAKEAKKQKVVNK